MRLALFVYSQFALTIFIALMAYGIWGDRPVQRCYDGSKIVTAEPVSLRGGIDAE